MQCPNELWEDFSKWQWLKVLLKPQLTRLPSPHQHRALQIRLIIKSIFLGFYLGLQEQDKITSRVHT